MPVQSVKRHGKSNRFSALIHHHLLFMSAAVSLRNHQQMEKLLFILESAISWITFRTSIQLVSSFYAFLTCHVLNTSFMSKHKNSKNQLRADVTRELRDACVCVFRVNIYSSC